jgi:hypothetical protein
VTGHTRHFIPLTCDHGPGDCGYARAVPFHVGALPEAWNPVSATRVVGHVQWNGMRDGVDAGMDWCQVCFQRGKDVQMATAENVCGPLCGYKCVCARTRASTHGRQAAWAGAC